MIRECSILIIHVSIIFRIAFLSWMGGELSHDIVFFFVKLVRKAIMVNDPPIRTNATLPGYAMMTIHIMQKDYTISQTRQTVSYVRDLLRAMKKEYNISAVNPADMNPPFAFLAS